MPFEHPHAPAAPRAPRRVALLLFAAVLLAAALPSPAGASRLQTDTVAGVTLAAAPALKPEAPDVSAPVGIVTDASGTVLWARRAHERRAMASTTKIMTAVVVLERASLDETVTISKAAAAVSESSAYLVRGEQFTVRQLLEALLVHSGNDAAVALAEHVGGSVPGFVEMMNAKASALGLTDTHYMNPHGLDVSGHYTSAADLATLGRYAMRNAEFRQILTLRKVTLASKLGGARVLYATDDLMGRYEGLEGIKTGFTNRAGYCFVSAAKRRGVELFGVVMGTKTASSRFRQTTRLLDWGFAHVKETQVIAAGGVVGTVPVTDLLERDIVAKVGASRSAVVFDLKGPVTRRYELDTSAGTPLSAGQPIGIVRVMQAGSVLATVPVVAAEDVPAPGFWERIRIASVRSWRFLFGPRVTRAAQVTATE